MGDAIVVAEGLGKAFGDKVALADLSFTVPAGLICGLLGPNGAGKTTLFRLLMGVLKASEGSLRVAGRDAFTDRVEVKRLVGYLPDEPVFYTYLSGRETIALCAAMHGLDPERRLAELAPLIERLDLAAALRDFAEEYSRGMKKKLGLILALAHRPRLLVLDEPTNGLDVESTHVFGALLRELAAAGTSVLFSSHLMDQVARLCSHALVIDRGRLVMDGGLDAIGHDGASLEATFLRLTAHAPA